MLSILGINYFNIASRSNAINNCGQALDLVNKGVIETFTNGTNEKSIADGMDAAIIAINKKTLSMDYATAINPIYIVRENEVIILKGDRFPIGKNEYSKNDKFTSKEFQLIKNDSIYLFSDGYADQFGGPNKRKMKVQRLNELLDQVAQLDISKQAREIESFFENWKGDTPQMDDVLLIGFQY